MGFFNKIIDEFIPELTGSKNGTNNNKVCAVCGGPLERFKSIKLLNGKCCMNCKNMFSPWFNQLDTATVEDIRYQLYCRRENDKRIHLFYPTKQLGTTFKVMIDEVKNDFAVVPNGEYIKQRADIISFANLTNCEVDILESRTEVKFKDSNDQTHSFTPPFYACSYDFYINIYVNIPYIRHIRFKLNQNPINNSQSDVIDMGQSGLFDKIKDMLSSERSYNGKTTNADEVTSTAEYKKMESIANEIKNALIEQKSIFMKNRAVQNSYIRCPWCNSKISKQETHCKYCNGPIEF